MDGARGGCGRAISAAAVWLLLASLVPLREADGQDELGTERQSGVRRALIVVGLAGDAEHEQLFRTTAEQWNTWLTKRLEFSPAHVQLLFASRDSLREAIEGACGNVGPDDTWWLMLLGHANYDGRRAWFHLPGPDVNDRELAEWSAGIPCREQVFWLTHTCSGWFLRPLSRKGRIVVTATAADNEFNETEFPQALATVAEKGAAELDKDGDRRVSIAELFAAVVAEVDARFAADERAATEHAQLDDDGDGRGTEAGDLADPAAEFPPGEDVPLSLRRDGGLAARTFVRWVAQDEAGDDTREAPQAD
jgi:hypothetical protein